MQPIDRSSSPLVRPGAGRSVGPSCSRKCSGERAVVLPATDEGLNLDTGTTFDFGCVGHYETRRALSQPQVFDQGSWSGPLEVSAFAVLDDAWPRRAC